MNKRIRKKKEKQHYEKAILAQYPDYTKKQAKRIARAIYTIKKSITNSRNFIFNS